MCFMRIHGVQIAVWYVVGLQAHVGFPVALARGRGDGGRRVIGNDTKTSERWNRGKQMEKK